MKFSFPTYIQHDQMDCGAAYLKIVAKHYHKTFSLKSLRDLCYVTHEGVSLFDIGRAAVIRFKSKVMLLAFNKKSSYK